MMVVRIAISNSRANFRLTVTSGNFEHWRHIALASIPTYEVNFDLLGTASVNTYPYPVDISAWILNITTGQQQPVTSKKVNGYFLTVFFRVLFQLH